MNVQKRNDVSIYCLSSGATLPEWLGDQAKRNLSKRDESIRRRIELLQDFQMPASSSKLVQSSDGRYIIAAGTYPPRIRCYDVHEMSLKFERYLTSECVDMVMLSEDFGKMALLLDDRTISFHAPYGTHESIRIPSFGRAIAYESTTCEILVAAKGKNIYRINLDEGRFGEPWKMEDETKNKSASISGTSIGINPLHPLATVGCDDGIVRFWDNRTPDDLLFPFLKLDVYGATAGYGYADSATDSTYGNIYNPGEITAMDHDPSGLYMAFGNASGVVALYDVRSSRPLHIQEHKHGLPINTVRFHPESGTVLSSDEKLIKAWRYRSSNSSLNAIGASIDPILNHNKHSDLGSVVVNVEGTGKLSHFIVSGDDSDPYGYKSGLILCATDQPKMESYYIPALGVAPKWCAFLENITEELEESDLQRGGATGDGTITRDGQTTETVFENYKFVSRDELEKLGISNLIGTPLLRGYMHGFFMDINLYNRVKAVSNPFEYEEYQKKKLKERLEAKRASRIAPRSSEKNSQKKTAVNPELAERLESKAKSSTKSGKVATNLLQDDRFGSLFTNPDFTIDQEDENFKLRNPSGVAAAKNKKNNLDSDSEEDEAEEEEREEDEVVDDEDELIGHEEGEEDGPDDEQYDAGDSSDSDDDGFDGVKLKGEAYDEMKKLERELKKSGKKKMITKKVPKMLAGLDDDAAGDEMDDKGAISLGLGDMAAATKAKQRREEMNMPLSKRFAIKKEIETDKAQARITASGSKEVSFIPKDSKRKPEIQDKGRKEERGKRSRRGVKELGFKKPFKHMR